MDMAGRQVNLSDRRWIIYDWGNRDLKSAVMN